MESVLPDDFDTNTGAKEIILPEASYSSQLLLPLQSSYRNGQSGHVNHTDCDSTAPAASGDENLARPELETPDVPPDAGAEGDESASSFFAVSNCEWKRDGPYADEPDYESQVLYPASLGRNLQQPDTVTVFEALNANVADRLAKLKYDEAGMNTRLPVEDDGSKRFDGSLRPACAVCHTERVYHLLVPCGHACVCAQCHAAQLSHVAAGEISAIACPICFVAVDVMGDATEANDEWGRPVLAKASPDAPADQQNVAGKEIAGASIVTALMRLGHGFPCADGSVAEWGGGLVPDEDLVTLRFLQIGTDEVGLLTRFVRTTGDAGTQDFDGRGSGKFRKHDSIGRSRAGTVGAAPSKRCGSIGSGSTQRVVSESAAARMRRNSTARSEAPTDGHAVDVAGSPDSPGVPGTAASGSPPGSSPRVGAPVTVLGKSRRGSVAVDANGVPYELPVAMLPAGQVLPGWVASSGAAPGGSDEDLAADKDCTWIAAHGPSTFEGTACDRAWAVYRCSTTALLYYVDLRSGEHTWTCPHEVAAELRQRAHNQFPDEHAYEGLGHDWETSGRWVPPSKVDALQHRSANIFSSGTASVWKTPDAAFEPLGSGVTLYFRLLRAFIWLFAGLAVLSLPSYLMFTAGARIPLRAADPLGFAHISLGNVGPVSDDTIESAKRAAQAAVAAAASAASNVTSATTAAAVTSAAATAWSIMSYVTRTFAFLRLGGTEGAGGGVTIAVLTGTQASYLITAMDVIACLAILLFAVVMRRRVTAYVLHAERRSVSTKDYSVYVRGLPRDITVEELRDHFSALFALDGSGVSATGIYQPSAFDASTGLRSIRVAPILAPAGTQLGNDDGGLQVAHTTTARPAGSADLQLPLLPAAAVPVLPTAAAPASGALGVLASMMLGATGKGAEAEAAEKAAKTAAKTAAEAERKRRAAEDRAVAKAAKAAASAVEKRERGGIVSPATPGVSFSHRLSGLVTGPVTDVSHNLNPAFMGSWVADVSVVQPVSGVLTAYNDAQMLHQQLRSARAAAKMYAPSAGLRGRYGPDPKKRKAAVKEVDRLSYQLEAITANLRRKGATGPLLLLSPNAGGAHASGGNHADAYEGAASGCIGAAFITFNQEESLQRCLRAYSGSHTWAGWLAQPAALRVRHPATPAFSHPNPSDLTGLGWEGWWRRTHDPHTRGGAGYRLWVEPAPDPSEVIHENLEVTYAGRLWRVAATNTVALLLVVAAVVLMILAQANSDLLTSRLPLLSACEAEVPALYMGSYTALHDARQAVADGYGASLWRPAPGGSTAPFSGFTGAGTGEGPARSLLAALEPNSTASDAIAAMASLPPLQLSRSDDLTDRAFEDQACPSGRYSVGMRYEFGPLPWHLRYRYPSLTSPSWAANATRSPYSDVGGRSGYYASSSANSAYHMGSAVGYGYPAEPADVCSGAQASSDAAHSNVRVDGQSLGINDPACPDPRRRQSAGGAGFCQCAPPAAGASCYTLPCFDPSLRVQGLECASFPASTLAGCYCVSSLKRRMSASGSVGGLYSFVRSDGDLCGRFTVAYVAGQLLVIAAGAVSSVVNMLLARVIPWLITMERHVSVSDRAKATTLKLAAVQTLNTALTALVINAKLPNGATAPSLLRALGLLSGDYSDFTPGWFAKVGAQICVTMMVNTLLPPLLSLGSYALSLRSRSLAAKTGWAKTQHEMNEVFVGPSFDITLRYPLVITFLVVTLLYSSGMPVLYVTAAVAFALQYTVDKCLLLRYFQRPPRFDASLALLVLDLLPLAVAAHLAVAVWTLSGGDMLPSGILSPSLLAYIGVDLKAWGVSIGDPDAAAQLAARWLDRARGWDPIGAVPRILRTNTFPLFVLLLLTVTGLTLSAFARVVARAAYSAAWVFSCGFACCQRASKGLADEVLGEFAADDSLIAAANVTPSGSVTAGAEGSSGKPTGGPVDPSSDSAEASAPSLVPAPATAGLGFNVMVVRALGRLAAARASLGGQVGRARTVLLHTKTLISRRAAALLARLPYTAQALVLESIAVRWMSRTGNTDPIAPCGVGPDGRLQYGPPPLASLMAVDGRTSACGKGLSPFTSEFSKLHDPRTGGAALGAHEIRQGWRLQVLDSDTLQDVYADAEAAQRAIIREHARRKAVAAARKGKGADVAVAVDPTGDAGGFMRPPVPVYTTSTTPAAPFVAAPYEPVPLEAVDTLPAEVQLPPTEPEEAPQLQELDRDAECDLSGLLSLAEGGAGPSDADAYAQPCPDEDRSSVGSGSRRLSDAGLSVSTEADATVALGGVPETPEADAYALTSGSISATSADGKSATNNGSSGSGVNSTVVPREGADSGALAVASDQHNVHGVAVLVATELDTAADPAAQARALPSRRRPAPPVSATRMAHEILLQVDRLKAAARRFGHTDARGGMIASLWVLRKLWTPEQIAAEEGAADGEEGTQAGANITAAPAAAVAGPPARVNIGTPATAAGGAPAYTRMGRTKRTWEVIGDAGLTSYDVTRNPRYREAAQLLREAAAAARATVGSE